MLDIVRDTYIISIHTHMHLGTDHQKRDGGGGGGWGIFSLYEFFFSRTACAGIFFPGETPARIFFQTNIAFFNSEILIHYLCFCETIELRKQHIKNLSDTQLTAEQIKFTLSRFEIHSNTCHERKQDKAPANFRLQPICQKDAPSIYLS